MRANEHAKPGSQPSAATSSDVMAILLATDTPFVWEPLVGRPLLAWSVAAFERTSEVMRVVLVVAPDRVQAAEALVRSESWRKTHVATAKGDWRAALHAGLLAIESFEPAWLTLAGLVVVHEAARPLVTAELIAAGIAAARTSGAAMAGEPVKETIKRVRDEKIVATVPRDRLVRAQTPLIFSPQVLRAALTAVSQSSVAPSPASLVALALAAGVPVCLVAGNPENLLVRAAGDLAVAAALLLRRMRAP